MNQIQFRMLQPTREDQTTLLLSIYCAFADSGERYISKHRRSRKSQPFSAASTGTVQISLVISGVSPKLARAHSYVHCPKILFLGASAHPKWPPPSMAGAMGFQCLSGRSNFLRKTVSRGQASPNHFLTLTEHPISSDSIYI
jgi:hypothetical protein